MLNFSLLIPSSLAPNVSVCQVFYRVKTDSARGAQPAAWGLPSPAPPSSLPVLSAAGSPRASCIPRLPLSWFPCCLLEPALEQLPEKGHRDVNFEPHHSENIFLLSTKSGAEDQILARRLGIIFRPRVLPLRRPTLVASAPRPPLRRWAVPPGSRVLTAPPRALRMRFHS